MALDASRLAAAIVAALPASSSSTVNAAVLAQWTTICTAIIQEFVSHAEARPGTMAVVDGGGTGTWAVAGTGTVA
jgi:hypothetical protein